MRKLIIAGAALAVMVALAFGLFAVASKLTARPETYAEQQARLAQEAANADLWRSIIWIGVAVAFLAVLPLIVWLWLVALGPAHRRQMEKARFERDYNVLGFDQLGNGPVIFDRENMQLITVESGNAPYPAQYTFVHGAMPQPVKEPRRQNYEVPLVINTGGMKIAKTEPEYSVKEVQPQQLPTADPERRFQQSAENFSPENEFSPQFQDFGDFKISLHGPLLIEAKRRGEDKVKSIADITKVKSGGNKAYQAYSKFWDSIEV
jgi:hypothetical protein